MKPYQRNREDSRIFKGRIKNTKKFQRHSEVLIRMANNRGLKFKTEKDFKQWLATT